ncbi:hypothetical protein K1719_007706 [Acacia pycnantha]|nr:hypothetical protein K1719_007706 [Acacia pycnantha]
MGAFALRINSFRIRELIFPSSYPEPYLMRSCRVGDVLVVPFVSWLTNNHGYYTDDVRGRHGKLVSTATSTANMRKESWSEEKGLNLLHQLEDILENDPLIDELGYIHPSQFSLLDAESDVLFPGGG